VKRLARKAGGSGGAGIRQRTLTQRSSSCQDHGNERHNSRKAKVYDDADSQTSEDVVLAPVAPRPEPTPQKVAPMAPPLSDLDDSTTLKVGKLDRSSIIDQSEYEYNPVFKNYQSVFENLMKAIRVDTDWAVINC
jgi:hypothetical protein